VRERVAAVVRERSPGAPAGRVAVLAVLLSVVAACSHGTGMDPEDSVPSPRGGTPVGVDVCELLTADEVGTALESPVVLVSAHYDAAGLATYECGYGDRAGPPTLRFSLAPGPTAIAVFDEAYGEPAGGDPRPLQNLGDRAYLRTESRTRSLHVFVGGSILSLSGTLGSPRSLRAAVLVDLSRTAVARLPSNPILGVNQQGEPCRSVPAARVKDALGLPTELSTQVSLHHGAIECSWAGLPGVVTISRQPGLVAVEEARAVVRASDLLEVKGVKAPLVRAWSDPDRPGDLLLIDGVRAVLRIEVVPSAGWAHDDMLTTPAELALAEAALASLN
jgi:hypothetical protein